MSREEIISQNPIADFVRSRGHELKAAGENFVTNGCPVKQHKKYHRPNTINPAKNLWHCNDCGGGGTVIDWLSQEKRIPIADAMRELGGGKNDSEPVATYDYTDEHDELLYQVCRFDPKDFRARRGPDDPQCKLGIKGVRRVLYRLPEVIKAQLVCIAEGEKNADDLSKLGFVATTNVFGAGKWRDEYNEILRGKDVVVFGDVGDADRTGEKHTEQVIASLLSSGISPRHAFQPNGFHDVSDYIASLPANTAAQAIAKLIDEAKFAPTTRVEAQPRNGEPVELPPPPPPYVPPPLDLLPQVLQKFVRIGAAATDVDTSFLFLPVLSELAACIGISRSVRIKEGYVEPAIIWTANVAPSGDGKSPGMRIAIRPQLLREMDLKRENDNENDQYEKKLAAWDATPKAKRTDVRPKKPAEQVCLMDDTTIEAVARRLNENARGLLLAKGELSHWFASFDQYRDKGGSDVARWLQLYDGDLFAVDRVSSERNYRISNPRISIASGVQTDTLGRLLTPEYFERGLPARILWAMPKRGGPRKFTKKVVSPELFAEVAQLFSDLRSLKPDQIKTEQDQPEHDEQEKEKQDRLTPKLLPLSWEAEQIFTAFYDEVGQIMYDASPRVAAQWSKLIGGSARLALVGQLAHDANAEKISGDIMKHAVALAHWFGKEAERILSQLAETPEQRERRELIEFIKRRGGDVYERDVMQSFTRLKNNKAGTERELTALVNAGLGKWEPVPTTEKGGRPARKFRYLGASTSTQPAKLPSVAIGSVDVDSPNSQKNEGASRPRTPPETLVGDESGVVRL